MRLGGTGVGEARTIPLELGVVVALLVADGHGLVPVGATPFLLALGWLSLRKRGLRFRDVGLARPPRMGRRIAIGAAAGVGIELLALLVTEPAIVRVTGSRPDLSELRPLAGDLGYLALFVALTWTMAAFGDELSHRGYVLNRLADLGRGSRAGWTIALVASSALYGWAHQAGHGPAGLLRESIDGFLLGVLYLATRRNLVAPIVAHGVADTLAFLLIYLGRYPGL